MSRPKIGQVASIQSIQLNNQLPPHDGGVFSPWPWAGTNDHQTDHSPTPRSNISVLTSHGRETTVDNSRLLSPHTSRNKSRRAQSLQSHCLPKFDFYHKAHGLSLGFSLSFVGNCFLEPYISRECTRCYASACDAERRLGAGRHVTHGGRRPGMTPGPLSRQVRTRPHLRQAQGHADDDAHPAAAESDRRMTTWERQCAAIQCQSTCNDMGETVCSDPMPKHL